MRDELIALLEEGPQPVGILTKYLGPTQSRVLAALKQLQREGVAEPLARADMVVQCQLKLILRPSQERTLERWLWRQVLATAAGWVGYTHAWRTCDARFKTVLTVVPKGRPRR